jgi:hypothetical protein
VLQGGGRPAYEGPFVAPITQGEQTGLGAVSGAAYDPNRAATLASTLRGDFLPGGAASNPFLSSMVQMAQAPILQNLSNLLTRDLPGRFVQAGQFTQPKGSGAFDRAAALAVGDTAGALGDVATKIYGDAYAQERGLQQQAIQLGQNEVDTLSKNLQAQGLPRLIEDLGVERGLAEFTSRMQSLMQALQIAAGAPIAQQGNVQTATSTSESQKGIIPGLMPKGLQAG